jgi:hypothetical protein
MSAGIGSHVAGGRDTLTPLRLQLRANGYLPVPVAGPKMACGAPGKQPVMKDWRNICASADKAEVSRWASSEPGCTNTGISCEAMACTDIDVPVPELAGRIERAAVAILGPTPLRRIGRAPKVLLAYRTTSPLSKMETPEFLLPDGIKVQVEILGAGQQFVAYGVHPDTGREYEWTESGPDVVPLTDLPVVAEADLRGFLVAAEAMLRAAGGQTQKEIDAAAKEAAGAGSGPARPETSQAPCKPARGLHSGAGSGSFFKQVNQAALDALDAWVPKVFSRPQRQTSGGYRVSSADLGRGYEEDLSIHPTGIQDFGPRRGLSPCDVVMEFGGAPTLQAAAHQLCEFLGRAPADFGWKETRERAGPTPNQEQADPDKRKAQQDADGKPWPEPVDFLDTDMTGTPELREDHLPDALYPFVVDTATRMGVDPAAAALACLTALASVMHDDWAIQPKRYDDTWTENPRIWAAVVGDPSILKTPLIRACTRPIDMLDAQARERHDEEMRDHKMRAKVWKDAGSDPGSEPKAPRLDRYIIEGATMEALSEALRGDDEARQRAPASKVLVRQDEMAEWVASFDRYRGGGKGGGDRGAYLRLYNGGRHTVDRIGRGSFAIPNWSACVLGGIQPDPIRRIARDADDDGLLQRFCYCVPGRQEAGEDRKPAQDAIGRYAALFPALTTLLPPKGSVAVLDEGAHVHRLEVERVAKAMALMPDTSMRLKAALGKWPGLFARLVLIFHLIEFADCTKGAPCVPPVLVVPEQTARRVAAYMRDVLLPHLLRAEAVMFATTQTGHARWVAGMILASGEARVTSRDVMRAYNALRAPEQKRDLLDVMVSLEMVGWVQAEPQRNPARPTTSWEVNPAVHRIFAARAQQERERRRDAQREMLEAMAAAKRGRP